MNSAKRKEMREGEKILLKIIGEKGQERELVKLQNLKYEREREREREREKHYAFVNDSREKEILSKTNQISKPVT